MRPELIINTASFRDINLCEKEKTNCWDLNVRGVEHILEAAQDFNPLYIQISSVHVFDGEEGLYKEDDGCKPINYFGKSMLSAERIIQKSGLEYLIARTAAVYGKSILSRNDFFSYVQLKLSRGETVKALKDHIIPPTCADELAMAIFQLVDKQEYGIYHIAGTQFCSYYEFALEIARVFNLDSKKIQAVSASEFKSPAQWPKNATFTLNKLYNKLNWLPSNIQDGLNRVKKQLD